MKYCGTLIAVKNIAKSKEFYEKVLEQKIIMDLGVHVSFESGISMQENYEELVGEELNITEKANSFELCCEVEDLDKWNERLKKINELEFIHEIKEYPWGQRVIRFYDFDKHVIEVAESMESVVKRFLKQGMSVEEAAKRSMFPIEFVEKCV